MREKMKRKAAGEINEEAEERLLCLGLGLVWWWWGGGGWVCVIAGGCEKIRFTNGVLQEDVSFVIIQRTSLMRPRSNIEHRRYSCRLSEEGFFGFIFCIVRTVRGAPKKTVNPG